VPEIQLVQEEAPVVAMNLPAAQFWQIDDADAPVIDEYVPTRQLLQELEPVIA